MIPGFGGITGNLPKGEHPATWSDVESKLGFSVKRKELLVGLLAACQELKRAGAKTVYIDGSFATKKMNPGDYDGCYFAAEVDDTILDPTLIDFSNERAAMKAKYLGELFPAESSAGFMKPPYREFFQADKNGRKKGIVVLDLGTLP